MPTTEQFLTDTSLDLNQIDQVLGTMLGRKLDAADIYFQRRRSESWFLEDRIVKEGSYSNDQGVGVRGMADDKTGFAYADEIDMAALQDSAGAAAAIANAGSQASSVIATKKQAPTPVRYQAVDPIASLDSPAKIALLESLDAAAREADPRVKQVMVSLNGSVSEILVAASDGTLASDARPLVRLNVTVIAEENGRREQASSGGGGRYAYHELLAKGEGFAREAVRQALVNLTAQAAPAGAMPVVLGAGWPGVLLHEAVGHGLEGDFNRKGTSAFAGRMGDMVASPLCTIVDDGTLDDRRGSLNIDDEGVPSQCTTLIENGRLVGYLQDKHNARLMGTESTGNGRRESYAHLPMPRMTNTYMLAGDSEPEDIIASVERGIYAVNFGGGQVDITSGQFVFSASEAYMIENGKVTYPVKGATLIGNGPEVMTQVSMVGNDLALDEGVGVCGKGGQSVPVGVGQPTLKIDSITVGGTAA